MATITYGVALGNFGYPPDFFDFASFTARVATDTKLKLVDINGATIVVTGTGLTYANGQVTGGIMTSFSQAAANGSLILSVTGAQLDAATVSAALRVDQDILALLEGDDLVIGSAQRDVVVGGGGDDTLRGGDGADCLVAMDGHDLMTGGAGKDVFVFGYAFMTRNGGTDTVTDFRDTGGALDDLIFIRQKDQANLTITQQGDDVVLDFGKADLVILNTTVDQIGLDDFTFKTPFAG